MSCIMYQGDGRSPSLAYINILVVCLSVCLTTICCLLCRIKLLDEKSSPKSVNAKKMATILFLAPNVFSNPGNEPVKIQRTFTGDQLKKHQVFNFINHRASSSIRITSQNTHDTEKTHANYMIELVKNMETLQIYSSKCCPSP